MYSLSSIGLLFIGGKFKDSGQRIYVNILMWIQKEEIRRIKAVRVASREEELLLQESCELMRIHPGLQGRGGGGGG